MVEKKAVTFTASSAFVVKCYSFVFSALVLLFRKVWIQFRLVSVLVLWGFLFFLLFLLLLYEECLSS